MFYGVNTKDVARLAKVSTSTVSRRDHRHCFLSVKRLLSVNSKRLKNSTTHRPHCLRSLKMKQTKTQVHASYYLN
ncbi:LacI family DNA-binding transcriptional regulator [Vibrio lentus]|nr:LacI family DNA-binding transcriptional regulator [Vibrio lentus]